MADNVFSRSFKHIEKEKYTQTKKNYDQQK
jgi:hypothetical protein